MKGLRISEISSDRSGDERAVNVVKCSNVINDGAECDESFERMDIVWK